MLQYAYDEGWYTIIAAIVFVPLVHDLVPAKYQLRLPHLVKLAETGVDLNKHKLPFWKHALFLALSTASLCTQLTSCINSLDAANLVLAISWLYATLYLVFRKPITPPYRLLLFCLAALSHNAIILLWQSADLRLCLSSTFQTILIALSLSLPMQETYPVSSMPFQGCTSQYTSPEDNISLFDYLTVNWMSPMLQLKSFSDHDPWRLSPLFWHKDLMQAMAEIKASSLFKKYILANSLDLVVDVSLNILSSAMAFVNPLILKEILELLGQSPRDKRKMYLLIFYSFALNVFRCVIDMIQSWHGRRCYERVRGALMCSVVLKALKRRIVSSVAGEQDEDENHFASVGEVVNLVTGDSYSVAQWFWDGLSNSISAPLEVLLAVTLLYRILGVATFSALIIFAFFTLLAIPIAKIQLKIRRVGLKVQDRRIALVSEILHCIRLLKNFAWTAPFFEKAQAARSQELSYIWRNKVLDAVINLLVLLTPGGMVFASFFTFSKVLQRELTIPVAFSTIAIYQMLLPPLNQLPQSILYVLRTLVGVRRLERFFKEEELPAATGAANSMNLERASFRFPGTSKNRNGFVLQVDHFAAKIGDLVVIHGDSASGKSALLQALLGEMVLAKGKYDRPQGSIAYASQVPWAESMTIRDNILFHLPYNKHRFEAVIEACDFKTDLMSLPHQELTSLGERGVSLSGGQRMRLALARALYSNAQYILLDDPFSALDAFTASNVLNRAILGPLCADRAVILVTHHMDLVKNHASAVYSVKNGVVYPDQLEKGRNRPSAAVVREVSLPSTKLKEFKDETTEDDASLDILQHQFLTQETVAKGAVRLRVYTTYLRAAGYPLWILLFTLLLLIRGFKFLDSYVLKLWGEDPADVNYWLKVYVSVIITTALVSFFRFVVGSTASYFAAKHLFSRCLARVLGAPTRYFDTVPVGRILNRLVSDINVTDSSLQQSIQNFLDTGLAFVSSFCIILVLIPAFLPFAVVLLLCYWRIALPYRRTARELRRLENKHRSPLFSVIGEVIAGLDVVRAYNQTSVYAQHMFSATDQFQRMDHFYWTAVFWLRVRFDIFGAASIASLMLICVQQDLKAGWSAFAIVSAQTFVSAIHSLIWNAAALELDLSSVERIDELLRVEQEYSTISKISKVLPAYWPSVDGGIDVDDLTFAYDDSLEPVLKHFNLQIPKNQKLAIVGRSGSGKSSLSLAFLRVAEARSGSIFIDGWNIKDVPLQSLRSRISYCPQEPLLFSGSVHDNIDPLREHSAESCLKVLQQVGIEDLSLHAEVTGASYVVQHSDNERLCLQAELSVSAGQRNLIALARALLRNAAIYILDESTAALDPVADARIQHVIRNLPNAIIISIAHRISSVIDFDRVIVMEDGRIIEDGNPQTLLLKDDTHFSKMWMQQIGQQIAG